MSDLDDKEDYQVHRNAWVKEHGTKRGFVTHNFKRYGFKNEAGLRRHIGRREAEVPTSTRDQGTSRTRNPKQNTKRDYESRDVSKLTDFEIIQIPYGNIEPTLVISDLSHDEWIDKFIMYDYYTIDPKAIKAIQKQWRTEYLTTMRNRLWDEDELLVLLPRGYGKTETVLALYIRWFLEVRRSLYVVAPSYSHNKEILRRMVHMIKSPSIRRKYGDIIGLVSYDKEKLTMTYDPIIGYLSLDPPLSMTTWNSAKEGPHPAWLVFDDVMQKDYRNIESNEEVRWKYSKTFDKMRTRRDGRRTRVSVIGTRYGMEDMYSYFMTVQKFKVLHNRALNEDGTMLYCPNYIMQDLLIAREKDVAAFETTMNNNPIPSTGIYFNAESWVELDTNPLLHQGGVQYYMAMDPARGMSDVADNTAMLVFGILNGVGTVVDGYVGKADDDKKLKEFDRLYDKYNPVFSLIEKTFAQIDMNRFNKYRGIIPYQDTVKKAKIMRINAMRGFFTDGLIQVLKQDSEQDKKEGKPYQFIYNEYLSYNETDSTPSRKDDAIDCLSMIIQHAGQYLEKYIDTHTDWSESTDFHLTTEE